MVLLVSLAITQAIYLQAVVLLVVHKVDHVSADCSLYWQVFEVVFRNFKLFLCLDGGADDGTRYQVLSTLPVQQSVSYSYHTHEG